MEDVPLRDTHTSTTCRSMHIYRISCIWRSVHFPCISALNNRPTFTHLAAMDGKKTLTPRCRALSDKDGRSDERWDVYFHAFLLHETKHSDCYYYKGRTYKKFRVVGPLDNRTNTEWWFPENRRNEQTLHMFVAARWAPLEQVFFFF